MIKTQPIKIVFIALVTFFMLHTLSGKAHAWWDSSWCKRRPVPITYSGSALTNYQVKVDATYDADMQTNF